MRPALITLIASAFALAAQPGVAQTAAKPAAAKSAKPAAKAKAKPAPPAPVEVALAQADNDQMAAAALAYVGEYACEFNQNVKVGMTPKHDGYLDVHYKAQNYTMKPVLSSTGALRLEDVRGKMLMLQIANKSMLMDVKIGQRIVDDCVHETQRAFTLANTAPAQQLLQAPAAAPK